MAVPTMSSGWPSRPSGALVSFHACIVGSDHAPYPATSAGDKNMLTGDGEQIIRH